jgi:hypothetical protein
MHLITQPVHVLLCSNSTMKVNKGTNRIPRYCFPNSHRTSPVFRCWNQAFQIAGFLVYPPNVNSSWCKERREGRLIWPYHPRVSCCLMSWFYGRDGTPSFTYLSITFCNQGFSNCNPTVDVGFVTLSWNIFCGNKVSNVNVQFFCHLCCRSCDFF